MAASIVYLGVGANLGEPLACCQEALDRLDAGTACRVEARSGFYRTEPVGPIDQPWFINAVARLRTSLEPPALLTLCQQVEQDLGRERGEHWGPRTIDLDLLIFDDRVCRTPRLTLPHPEISRRRFVLEPLAELAPDLEVPSLQRTVRELLAELPDRPVVERLSPVVGGSKS